MYTKLSIGLIFSKKLNSRLNTGNLGIMKQIIDLKNAFGFTHVRSQLIFEKPLRALLRDPVVKPVENDVHLTIKVVKIAQMASITINEVINEETAHNKYTDLYSSYEVIANSTDKPSPNKDKDPEKTKEDNLN